MTNAVRHAQACSIRITLEEADNTIIVNVEDDGIGLPAEHERGNGMGLKIMQYRAGLIGAILNIDSSPDGGTVVTCRLSLPKRQAK